MVVVQIAYLLTFWLGTLPQGTLGFSIEPRLLLQKQIPTATALYERSNTASSQETPMSTSSSTPHDMLSRRDALKQTAVAVGSGAAAASVMLSPTLSARAATKGDAVPISATWSAVDGLNSNDDKTVAFDYSAYKAMKDDPSRTPYFQKAIEGRLGNDPESMVVLDLGTGPFALFALIAAQSGAGKVYAIEANPEAAASARQYVKKAGYDDVITIVEGFSTEVKLPEKVNFCIAEIIGSISTEEGAYATVRDAHQRFLKNPNNANSWIPCRIQTYAAPASYNLHNLLRPPDFDWTKLKGQPVRFNCRDTGLELLADPVLVEDVVFGDIVTKEQETRNQKKEITFTVDSERIKENVLPLQAEFRRGGNSVVDSEVLAINTAHSLSGIALWPRLFLDDNTVIDSRHYGDGAHQRSHWQTVLPIMSADPVGDLKGGEQVKVTFDFKLPTDVSQPPVYSIQGSVQY